MVANLNLMSLLQISPSGNGFSGNFFRAAIKVGGKSRFVSKLKRNRVGPVDQIDLKGRTFVWGNLMQQRAQGAEIKDRSRVLGSFSKKGKCQLILSFVCVPRFPRHACFASRTKSSNIECLFPLLQSELRDEIAQRRYASGVIASM